MTELFSKVPVTIVTGFLGSGKTTLMNRILNGNSGRRIAVMVNDFGEINIDSQLVVSAQQNMVSLANGCICCSVENDLIEQLHNLLTLREGPPEHILIETSGVSDPMKVVNTLKYPQFRDKLSIDAVIAMLDADQFHQLDGDQEQVAMCQLAAADIVIINKIDLAQKEQIASLKNQWLFPKARAFETNFADIPLELLFGIEQDKQQKTPLNEPKNREQNKEMHCASTSCDHSEHQHEKQFSTFSWQSEQPLSLAKLRRVLKELPETIYRAKGLVYFNEVKERSCIVHLVGIRTNIEKGPQWQTEKPSSQLVMIAWDEIDKVAISSALDSCIVK
ncbi:MAG: G3E family GTPase [Colwellia sp.]|jgi:G3E family GTPase